MSIFKKLTSAAFAAVFALTLAGFAAAQDNSSTTTPDKTQTREGRDGRGFGRHGGFRGEKGEFGHRGGGMGMFRDLNLTDAQKEQVRSILEKNKPDQATMEEMRSIHEAAKSGTLTDAQKARLQQLREQGKANREAVHAQLLAVLTPEQRQQLETRQAEMEKRREEFRQKRQAEKAATKPTDN